MTTKANGIEIAYESFGDPAHPTLLLIMGLGAQRVMWDDEICELLVGDGHHVIRFDNRDVGESTWIEAPGLDIGATVINMLMGERPDVPYLLSDMALDAVGLLDALQIDAAHVIGASMGGMIAQTMAIEHPKRVRSLTSIMSSTGEPGLGEPSRELTSVLLGDRPTDRTAAIEASVELMRAIGTSEHFDEERARSLSTLSFDRGINPVGVGHQLLATLASGSRAEGLARLDLPTLVIHGRRDQVVDFSGGQRTADLIPGAHMLAIDDMAHDLPRVHWERAVDAVTALTSVAR